MWKNKIMNNIVKSVIDLFFKKKEVEQAGNNPIVKDAVQKFYEKESNMFSDSDTSILDASIIDDDKTLTDMDRMLQNKPTKIEGFLRENTPMIYAFTTKHVPNMIKVGFTDQGVMTRIQQWQRKYPDLKEPLGYWSATELDIAKNEVFFKDLSVHKRINKHGYAQINVKEEADTIRQLAINQGMHNLHISQEFFHKYCNLDLDEKAELSQEILTAIIEELKQDIRENKNLADVDLYKLVGDGGTNKADTQWPNPNIYEPTPLQETTIKNGIDAIKDGKTDLLMAAVMRSGKGFMSLQIIKRSGAKFALITSAKADVRPSWRNEINHVDFIDDFVFLEFEGNKISETSKDDGNTLLTTKYQVVAVNQLPDYIKAKLAAGKIVIVFATLQDLAGKLNKEENIREIKVKHNFLYDPELPIDIMVIDETHYGSHSGTYGTATGLNNPNEDQYKQAEEYINKELDVEERKYAKEELKELENTTRIVNRINAKVRLQCSGTPYYILTHGEFSQFTSNKTIISTVTFSNMVEARDEWAAEHSDAEQSKSPYFGIPNIIKFGMQISNACRKELGEAGFSVSMEELFKMDNNGEFLHKKAILSIMHSVFGDNHKIKGLTNLDKSVSGELFKHCIMVIPHIKTCPALKTLLENEKIFKDREIIVLTENRTSRNKGGYGVSKYAVDSDALNEQLNKLESEGKKSLCITVKRMLTGVSVPLWDCMLYMKDTTSAQEYDQAIFRLCTRNVKTAINRNNDEIKINKKPNVYLIDFNVDRMFQLAIDSATAQAAAEGKYSPKDIEDTIKEQNKYLPIIAETHTLDNARTLEGLHEIQPKDLLRIYANYNRDKDIESNIADSIASGNFKSFLNDINNLKIVNKFEETNALGSKEKLADEINPEGSDSIDISGMQALERGEDVDFNDNPSEEKQKESDIKKQIKAKFIGMLKNMLYFNICLDEPCKDIDDLVNRIENDETVKNQSKIFNLDADSINELYNNLSNLEKGNINILLLQLNTLLNDESIEPIQRVQNAIAKLGRIMEMDGKEYFVTKPELARKMIEKIPDEEWKKAENILTVNSKVGEWVIEIYKKYGKEVANKVKIVPAGEKTKLFIKKSLNILGLDEYNILDIEDADDNNIYNINDFLKIDNKNLLKISGMNKTSKFSFCIMNPPYLGENRNDYNFPLKFLNKVIEFSDRVVSIQPIMFLFKTYDRKSPEKTEKEILSTVERHGCNVEEMKNNTFDAAFGNKIGIIDIDTTKKQHIIVDDKIYNSVKEINKFSQDNLLIEFVNIIKPLYEKENVCQHMIFAGDKRNLKGLRQKEEDSKSNKWFLNIAVIRGHKGMDDMYSMIPRDRKPEYGQRSSNYINFNTYEEADNFVNYAKTYFCSCAIYLNKNDINLSTSLNYVPWFDFSDSHFSKSPKEIDDWLFKKYGISNEIRNHIEEILPDYYGIRKED